MVKIRGLPRPVNAKLVRAISSYVEPETYRLFASSEKPADIPDAGPKTQAVVVAASQLSSSAVPGLPRVMTPSGVVILVRSFRSDSSGVPPRKVDDSLYYESSNGLAWRLHSKGSSDHHLNIVTSTGLAGLMHDFNMPQQSSGTLDQYQTAGGNLDFTGPFGKRSSGGRTTT